MDGTVDKQFELNRVIYLLSYYLANKWSFHVRSQGLEIPTLIGDKIYKLSTSAIKIYFYL